MAYFKKYRCEFKTIDNKVGELSIWQNLSSQPTITDIKCHPDSIELINEEINISDSFISSQRLDFNCYAESNWQYHDLYSVNMFHSRVDLTIDGQLLYIGWIDSESYEEPFDSDSKYMVTVKSGNLKLAKRLDYNVGTVQTISNVITDIIRRVIPSAQININIDTYAFVDGVRYRADALEINPYVFFSNSNFKSPKCWEVLEGICKAFQLRIIVSGNNVNVVDLTTIKGANIQPINIINGSELSFDETFNKIHITLDLNTDKPIKDYKIDDSLLSGMTGNRISIYQGASNPSLEDTAFYYREKQLTTNATLEGLTITGDSATYIGKINSYYEGDNSTFIRNKKAERITSNNRVIATFNPVPIFLTESDNWYLNIKLDTMLSVLTDPFGNANRAINASNWWRDHENHFLYDSTLVYVPLNVYLKDDNGKILYYLDNTNNQPDYHWSKGEWRTGTPAKGAYRLAYYSSNYQNHTAFTGGKYQPKKVSGSKCSDNNKGWATNSQHLTWKLLEHNGKPQLITDMNGKGSIAKLPPTSGTLHIELLSGIDCVMYNDHYGTGDNGKILQKYEDIAWLCYKDLGVSITDSNGKEYYSDDQIEYEVNLNEGAEKELSYDTKIGTVIDGDKSAKAGITYKGEFVTEFNSSAFPDKWYLEEHIMRTLEPILTKNRYSLSIASNQISMTAPVNISVKGKVIKLVPTEMRYIPATNKCKTKLIEL